MGKSETVTILGVLALALTLTYGMAFPQADRPLIRNADRSVYARRSFALPDVVSDVYEVYVGPSVIRENPEREAAAVLQGQHGVQGVIVFKQMHPNDAVLVEGNITGLSPGLHGFHIHQKGDVRNGCGGTGGHYNPYSQEHGAPMDRIRHVGDLGNIAADEFGNAKFMFYDNIISLSGINSIVGRAILVHGKADDVGRGEDAESKKTGNAGPRIACGVVGLA